MTSARFPCEAIKRYPVVARWRNHVDYVAAGIYCFQPYCVTGELDPPANPLICPKFCVRFNDLDYFGLTGRHYSGFIMLGFTVLTGGLGGFVIGIIGLIEGIIYLTKSDQEFRNVYVNNKKEWF
jgi:hypothetical protein